MNETVIRLSQENSASALLKLAKRDIDAGDTILCKAGDFYEGERVRAAELYRSATEHMAMAHDNGASQRRIAGYLGKSPAWVNRLLRWYELGCEGTPFGPQSKASREHARVQAAERTMKTKGPRTRTQHGDELAAAAAIALATNASARPETAPASIPHTDISSLEPADTVLGENGSAELADRERLLDAVQTPSSSEVQKGVDTAPAVAPATKMLSAACASDDYHLPQELNRQDPDRAFQRLTAQWSSIPFRNLLLESPKAAQFRFLRDVVLAEVGGPEALKLLLAGDGSAR